MSEMTEIFGEPIATYTARQAIEDGVLVEPHPTRFPGWLMTRGVYDTIVELGEGDERCFGMRAIPLLMDARMIVMKRRDHLHTKGLEGNVTGKTVWIAENDLGAYTLLFPDEY